MLIKIKFFYNYIYYIMYVIVKREDNTSEIVNMLYNKDSVLPWINEYINDYIVLNLQENIENYNIKQDERTTFLYKKESIIKKGYFINENKTIEKLIYSIELLEYNCKNVPEFNVKNTPSINLWENINDEINNRVLKNMDKESLYQFIVLLKTNINLKNKWTSNEFTNLTNEYLKSFRKELYSSVAKRMKRRKL